MLLGSTPGVPRSCDVFPERIKGPCNERNCLLRCRSSTILRYSNSTGMSCWRTEDKGYRWGLFPRKQGSNGGYIAPCCLLAVEWLYSSNVIFSSSIVILILQYCTRVLYNGVVGTRRHSTGAFDSVLPPRKIGIHVCMRNSQGGQYIAMDLFL